jgi:hypothetical protein
MLLQSGYLDMIGLLLLIFKNWMNHDTPLAHDSNKLSTRQRKSGHL